MMYSTLVSCFLNQHSALTYFFHTKMDAGWMIKEKNLQFDEHTTQSTIKIPQITKQFTTLQLCCFHPIALIPLLC